MSEDFKVDIVNPDRSFFSNDKVKEIVVPAVEGDMGILKDHIPIISFLKPGIIFLSTNEGLQKFYVEDGIIEFRDNTLSILTSTIMDLKNIDKSFIDNNIHQPRQDKDYFVDLSLIEDLETQFIVNEVKRHIYCSC